MQQARDFLEESDALAALLQNLPAEDWTTATLFKNWTINDVVVHLYYWNIGADLALVDPDAFQHRAAQVVAALGDGGLRPVENAAIAERGAALFRAWQAQYRDMADRWATVDPNTRVAWIGPSMSARSSLSARQMETWAHAQAVFDLLGRRRSESDRIRNVVMLGVNAFGWSHKVQGLPMPERMPYLSLTAPSGAIWTFGEPDPSERIKGSAVAFAQVVTQTRNVADTDLQVTGTVARSWMHHAQCFAGPKETPPKPGARHIQGAD